MVSAFFGICSVVFYGFLVKILGRVGSGWIGGVFAFGYYDAGFFVRLALGIWVGYGGVSGSRRMCCSRFF